MKPLLRRCGHPLAIPAKVLLLGSPLLSGHQVLDTLGLWFHDEGKAHPEIEGYD